MNAATQNEIDRLRAERDSAIEQVAYWRERALYAEGREQALAAHVELLREAGAKLAIELAEWSLTEHHDETDAAFDSWSDAVSQQPTTSLTRFKSEWQADELSAMIAVIPFSESLARDMLKQRRDELRRQAEGGE